MSDLSASLVARLQNHEADALAEYIEMNRRQLLVFIERQLGPRLRQKVEPEDILQEVSAEAVRALPSVEVGDDPFSWLCQVAQRRIVDAHRRFFDAQKRDAGREVGLHPPAGTGSQKGGLVDLLVVSMTTPSQAFSRNAREARLQAAIEELDETQQQALKLRYVENLPTKTIAERLGKSDGAIRVMLTRSLKKLEGILGER